MNEPVAAIRIFGSITSPGSGIELREVLIETTGFSIYTENGKWSKPIMFNGTRVNN